MRRADIKRIQDMLGQYPIRRAILFGSRATGEARPDSDIDIAIEFSSGWPMSMIGDIQYQIEQQTGLDPDINDLTKMRPDAIESMKAEGIILIGDDFGPL